MSDPDPPVPARPENAECVVPADDKERRRRDVIVIIILIATGYGHWKPDEVIDLMVLILGALGARTLKQA